MFKTSGVFHKFIDTKAMLGNTSRPSMMFFVITMVRGYKKGRVFKKRHNFIHAFTFHISKQGLNLLLVTINLFFC